MTTSKSPSSLVLLARFCGLGFSFVVLLGLFVLRAMCLSLSRAWASLRSHCICRGRSLLRGLPLAVFFAIGVLYASGWALANWEIYKAVNWPGTIEEKIAGYEQAASVFPVKTAFRQLPAYTWIYIASGLGIAEAREPAIRSVQNALTWNPNSYYLRRHLEGLQQ